MADKLELLFEEIAEKQLWDDVDFREGRDDNGDHFFIFGSWDDHDKFVKFAIGFLGLDDDTSDYDLERELDTNFVFSDEYTLCDDCQDVVRTSPDSYHWQPQYYMGDGFLVCEKCFNQNGYVDDYIEDKINNPKNAINGLVDEEQLKVRGFRKANDDSYENGFHRGQTDDPQTIYEDLHEQWDEVIFVIDSVGQFDTHFSAWVRNEEDVVGR